jgi:hypothetical protein
MCRQILVKLFNAKFYENLFTSPWVVTCGRTDRHRERRIFCNLWLRKHLTFWRSQSPLWKRFGICTIIINWPDFDRNTDGTYFIEIYYKNQINDIGTHSRVLLYASRTKRANFLCCTWHVSVLIGYTSNKWQLLHKRTASRHGSTFPSVLPLCSSQTWRYDMTWHPQVIYTRSFNFIDYYCCTSWEEDH